MNRFNIRVYGILFNDKKEVLITNEFRSNLKMSKFPGGGLEFGEGTMDCLKREIREELEIEAVNLRHFYTTDFFVQSAFNTNEQLISIYYFFDVKDCLQIPVKQNHTHLIELKEGAQNFQWVNPKNFNSKLLTFPIDQQVMDLLKKEH